MALLIISLIGEKDDTQVKYCLCAKTVFHFARKYRSSFHFSSRRQVLCFHQSALGAFYGDKCIQGLAVKCAFFISDKAISFNHNLACNCCRTKKDNAQRVVAAETQQRYLKRDEAAPSTVALPTLTSERVAHSAKVNSSN